MGYYADLIKGKQEKRNGTVKRGNISYGRYEINKERESFSTQGYAYVGYIYSDDNVYKTAPHDSVDECERDIMSKKYFKAYNSKEEKDNSLIGLFEDLRPKDEKTVKEYIRQVKNFIRQCEAKSERSDYAKDYRDLNKRAAESYKKDVEKAERWLSEHHNSKEEKGYYAKLAEEKTSRKH